MERKKIIPVLLFYYFFLLLFAVYTFRILFAPAGIAKEFNVDKSGIFINMSFLKQDVLEKLDKYLEYIKDQEHNLNNLETQKQEFKETYFNMKGNKDNVSLTNSYGTHI